MTRKKKAHPEDETVDAAEPAEEIGEAEPEPEPVVEAEPEAPAAEEPAFVPHDLSALAAAPAPAPAPPSAGNDPGPSAGVDAFRDLAKAQFREGEAIVFDKPRWVEEEKSWSDVITTSECRTFRHSHATGRVTMSGGLPAGVEFLVLRG